MNDFDILMTDFSDVRKGHTDMPYKYPWCGGRVV